MALSTEAKLAQAEDLIINSDLNYQEICEIVGVSDRTLRDYRENSNVDQLRKSAKTTTPKILVKLTDLLLQEMDKEKPDADQIVKYSKSIEYLKNKELILSDYIKMFRRFTEWLFVRNAEAAKMLNVHMKDFIHFIMHGRD